MDNERKKAKEFAHEIGQVVADYIYSNTKTCLRCSHFNESTEICGMYAQRPPARVITFGCEHFDEEIPF